jgi:hypothetical protein
MTYGDSVSDLREAMTKLLHRHRILQPLGGPGIHTVPETTTPEQPRIMGQEIQRFRYVVLSWCAAAVDGVAPKFPAPQPWPLEHGPADLLNRRLRETMSRVTTARPSMEDLSTAHPNHLVETWRQAAKACVLGELDLSSIDHTRLDAAQCRVVLKDAADFTRGLLVLDRRYSNVPGWEHLKSYKRLDAAAELASGFAASGERDCSVDLHGWRPAPAAILEPVPPGVAGAVQAQHNMLVDLSLRFPNALNLRRIIGSQVQVTCEAIRLTEVYAPELTEGLRNREWTFRFLGRESRNLGGLVGSGGPAAAESSNAYDRLRDAATSDPGSLRELSRLFSSTDARIASLIEHGFEDRRYFVSVKAPLPSQSPDRLVSRPRERWVPVASSVQTDLLPLVRDRLRPVVSPVRVIRESIADRDEYMVALHQQPKVRPCVGGAQKLVGWPRVSDR